MKKHVTERISSNGPIQYVWWVEVAPTLSQDQLKELLEYCHKLVQEKWYKWMSIDIADHEKDLQNAFISIGWWKKTNHYVVSSS